MSAARRHVRAIFALGGFKGGEAAEILMSFFIRVERRACKWLAPIRAGFRSPPPPPPQPEVVVTGIGTVIGTTVQPCRGELSTPPEPVSLNFLTPPQPNQQRGGL